MFKQKLNSEKKVAVRKEKKTLKSNLTKCLKIEALKKKKELSVIKDPQHEDQ